MLIFYGFWGMSYNSIPFIIFILVFLSIYFIAPSRMKVVVIILGNLFFYRFTGGWNMMAIVALTALVLYVFSRMIGSIYEEGEKERPAGLSVAEEVGYWKKYKKKALVPMLLGIGLILFVLIYTKAGRVLNWAKISALSELSFGRILVPLGLSYYTFSSVGYLIDVYKRKIQCTKNFIFLFACITFFPTIIEGPISHYDMLMEQLGNIPEFDYVRLCKGLQRMLWGLFKKMVIADRISLFTSVIFGNVFEYAGAEIAAALVLNVLQLYTDFSGCMDIVIGISESMGIRLEENFDSPLLSMSISDFWRRWHITLFEWFRNYIYMPIVQTKWFRKLNKKCRNRFGSQFGPRLSSITPSFVVWIIAGLWHGTGKDYIAWGLYWALLTSLSNMTQPFFEKMNVKFHFRTKTFAWKLFRILRTDFCYLVSGMIVAAGSNYGLHGLLYLTKQLLLESRLWKIFNGAIFTETITAQDWNIILGGILILAFVDYMNNKKIKIRDRIAEQPLVFRWMLWITGIAVVIIFGEYGPGYSATEFIYRGF